MRATRTEAGIVNGRLTEQNRLKKGDEQKATDARYETEGAKERITQFESHKGRVEAGDDHILRETGWLEAGIDNVRHQLVEHWQPDQHSYLRPAFATLEALMAAHRGRFSGLVHVACTNTIDCSRALIETVNGLRGPFAIVN